MTGSTKFLDGLIGTLETDAPELAEKYLDVDLDKDQNHIDEIQKLVDRRINKIRTRDGFISRLSKGPVVILHLIPSGVFSGSSVDRVENLPIPPIWGMFKGTPSPEVTGEGKYTTNRRGPADFFSYTYIRTDGLFEAVSSEMFHEDVDEKWITNHKGDRYWLDLGIFVTAKAGLNRLQSIGFKGNVHVIVTFLDVSGYRMTDERSPGLRLTGYPRFNQDEYQTELVDVPVSAGDYVEENGFYVVGPDDLIFSSLEPIITQYWQQLGERTGCPYFDEERNWIGGPYKTRV